MIETEAVVVGTGNGVVEVESAASAGCGRCSTQGGCGGGRTILGTRSGSCRMQVYGDLPVGPGDRVVVGLPESGYLRASVALYLVPLAGMFAVAGVAEWLVNRFNPAGADVLILVAGLLGLTAGFLWQRGFNRQMAHDPRFRARLLRRVASGDEADDAGSQAA